ncbi:MAG TPA: hypothetical protein VD814_06700, partial [Nocardioides sp.]|nr:hypothetical protein [Nocardioides sp.]
GTAHRMEAATIDAILTILALVGVAVLVMLAERVLGPGSAGPEGQPAAARVAVTSAPEDVVHRSGS